MKVALTGGIGAGKSTACEIFLTLGVTVLSADSVARELVTPGSLLLKDIIEHFGQDYLNEDGSLNRDKLRETVFKDESERRWLEEHLHPEIRKTLEEKYQASTSPYCIIEVPLLTQENKQYYDRILTIDCDESQQIERTTYRDNLPEEQVKAMMSAQISREERIALSDDIITNEGNFQTLKEHITRVHEKYLELAKNIDQKN